MLRLIERVHTKKKKKKNRDFVPEPRKTRTRKHLLKERRDEKSERGTLVV